MMRFTVEPNANTFLVIDAVREYLPESFLTREAAGRFADVMNATS